MSEPFETLDLELRTLGRFIVVYAVIHMGGISEGRGNVFFAELIEFKAEEIKPRVQCIYGGSLTDL